MDDDVIGPASPLPSEVALDLRRLVERCPRVRGFRFLDRERAEILMADGDDAERWAIHLPAMIRCKWVTNLSELVEAEIAAPIQPGDVAE